MQSILTITKIHLREQGIIASVHFWAQGLSSCSCCGFWPWQVWLTYMIHGKIMPLVINVESNCGKHLLKYYIRKKKVLEPFHHYNNWAVVESLQRLNDFLVTFLPKYSKIKVLFQFEEGIFFNVNSLVIIDQQLSFCINCDFLFSVLCFLRRILTKNLMKYFGIFNEVILQH